MLSKNALMTAMTARDRLDGSARSSREQRQQSSDVGLPLDTLHDIHDLRCVRLRKGDCGQTPEFLLDLGRRERMLGAATSLLDVGGQSPSVIERGLDMHRMALSRASAVELGVVNDVDSRQQRHDV